MTTTKDLSDFKFIRPINTKGRKFGKDMSGKEIAPRACDVQITPFPLCCGAKIIHTFFRDDANQQRKLRKDFEYAVDQVVRRRAGIIPVIVNQEQYPYMKEILYDNGFRLVLVTTNPNMSDTTIIYLFVKDNGGKDVTEEFNEAIAYEKRRDAEDKNESVAA